MCYIDCKNRDVEGKDTLRDEEMRQFGCIRTSDGASLAL